MANLVDTLAIDAYTPLQINVLKNSLKESIDRESNIDLLRKCALLLSSNKDMHDLNRAISMDSLLSMVKEDIHTMYQNDAR